MWYSVCHCIIMGCRGNMLVVVLRLVVVHSYVQVLMHFARVVMLDGLCCVRMHLLWVHVHAVRCRDRDTGGLVAIVACCGLLVAGL